MVRIFIFGMICSLAFLPALSAQLIELDPIQIVGAAASSAEAGCLGCVPPESWVSDNSGVDLQNRMGFGFLQDVSIRGGVFEDAGIFLNGVSLNNPQTGHYHLSLPGVSSDVQRSEVRLNGQAIQFHLVEPRRDENYFRTAFGNAGFAEQVAALTRNVNGNYHRFSAEGLRTDGLRDDTDGRRWAGSYLFRRRGDENDITLYMAVSEKKFGVNGAYAAPWYMREQEYLKQEFLMGSWTLYRSLDITVKPYFHRTQNTFLLDRDDPAFYRNDHTAYVSGNILEVADPDSGRFIALGAERHDIRSTNLGIHKRTRYDGRIGMKPQRDGAWRYEGDIQAVYFDQFPLKILPRLEAVYQLSTAWEVTLKAERVMRQPSFTELYYQSPSNVGNPDLGLQRSDNAEVAVGFQSGDRWFKSGIFLRRQKDTIDWARAHGEAYYQAINAGKVDVRGIDLSGGFDWKGGFFDRASVFYTYLDLDRERMYDISKYAFEYLRHRAVIKLEARPGKWAYGVKGIFESHVSLGDRWLFGAEAAYQMNDSARFFVAGDNLFDKRHEEFRYLQGEPLFVKAGLELRF